MSFEPRHENKSCSACPEDQLKPFKLLKISNFLNFQIFLICPGSQLLSDFQTFFEEKNKKKSSNLPPLRFLTESIFQLQGGGGGVPTTETRLMTDDASPDMREMEYREYHDSPHFTHINLHTHNGRLVETLFIQEI